MGWIIDINWIIGEPEVAGWYLAVVKTNDEQGSYLVLQLWFNPQSTEKWWSGGGYVSSKAEPYSMRDHIMAYAEMPTYT